MRCPTWRDQDVLLIGVMRRRSKRWRMGTVRRRAWWAAAASPRYYLVSPFHCDGCLEKYYFVSKEYIIYHSQGPISTNVKLPKCGLVCGEKVTVTVKVLLSANYPQLNSRYDEQ